MSPGLCTSCALGPNWMEKVALPAASASASASAAYCRLSRAGCSTLPTPSLTVPLRGGRGPRTSSACLRSAFSRSYCVSSCSLSSRRSSSSTSCSWFSLSTESRFSSTFTTAA
uniref:Uncharacterized protein n=1 Tax=Mus musculus TaxID=10090 RepID=Q8C1R7_MOUSE|nr:unnamed protein product [Mus musculus]